MWLVAATLGLFTLGAYLGRHVAGGASLLCYLLGFGCIVGLNFARNAGGLAVGLLFASGASLGAGLGGSLDSYASGAVWHAAAATALFVAALGTVGFTIRSDLSGGYRFLFFALLALIVYGFVSLFVAMPGGNVIYALVGLGVFGGYTLLDFNRMRRAGNSDVPSLAAGIFLDILNIFVLFLQLFGREQN
jgi:modulator of FtsH protease